MTGRARGRSRGRGRGDAPGQAATGPPRPGARAAPAPTPAGRARGRGTEPAAAAPRPGKKPAPAAAAPKQAPASARRRAEARPGDKPSPPEGQMAGMSLSSKQGTYGQAVDVVANHFKLTQLPNWGLYQYTVSFSPEIESRGLRMMLLKDHRDMLGHTRAFDGMTLFLPKRLPDPVTKVVSTRKSDGADIQITITMTNELPANSPMCLQLYNTIFRRLLGKIDMQHIGRNYYNPEHHVNIPSHKLEVWPGFCTSILQYETSVLLCADICHQILHSDTVLDMFYAIYNSVDKNAFYDTVAKKFVGEIVLTPYNNKTYRIDDIAWDKHPTDTFKKGKEEIDLVSYYQKAYNLQIKDMQQPLLVSMPKARDRKRGWTDPVLLVPELCRLTGLSDELRANFSVMKDLAAHTRVSPDVRSKQLEQFVATLNSNKEAQAEMSGWNMGFEKNLLQIKGRALPTEKMFQKDCQFTYKQADADWSRETRGKQLISSVNLPGGQWLLLHTQRDASIANDFVSTLKSVAGPMGMNIGDPVMLRLNDDSARTYLQSLKENIKNETLLAVCIVPNNRKDRYDAIKKACCVEHPVPSQVIVSRTLSKKQMLMSVATKIAIQMNCKLGGEVWAVEIPLQDLMVIGVDTYFDSLTKGKSVTGFVASTNRNLTRYYSRCSSHTTSTELADCLKVNMTSALKKYNEVNGKLPEQIILYRDGVGDGQLANVIEHEIPQITSAFGGLAQGYKPKMAVVVVNKRISTKLFLRTQQDLTNPPPGTVVDTEVTRPEWYDFFLISQSVRQGTVTPTHYNVVYDTTKLGADHMQRLTYKLTHLYYNWPGTIGVPAPCQYAHKMAFMVGQSLHTSVADNLCDRLFYL